MELKKFKIFIGTWKTTGIIEKTKLGPAGKLRATDTYEWGPHKDFVLHKVKGKMGKNKVVSSEVISRSTARKSFSMYSFEDGSSTGFTTGKLQGNKWSIDGKTMRFRGEFNSGGSKLRGQWFYKDKTWKLWMTIELVKN